ncbi:flagellar hook-length control protein FliK [Vibrio owensii]|uniref:Flagellar hook-length control protein FliK n=1 Tax=Vibrio owensii CAIM 1854 = LMG 25443 TaxID=1229493 RepID=A0A0C1Z3C4_9VIBR|nr:flagellar hook-length control protein FliK [Vibrio owensii]KIF51560.1 flagellar hook-length control protein FliK [Vibrio owensii CAIM 1854 = LMG 25443]
MNVNLSNVSATDKTSVPDSSSKVAAENPESKGFFETLDGVFTDSQKAEKAVAKSDAPEVSAENIDEETKVAEAVDGEKVASAESTDELLAQGDGKQVASSKAGELSDSESASSGVKQTNSSEGDATQSAANGASNQVTQGSIANQTQPNDADVSKQAPDAQVKSAMGEGQQLLGRIEQANQTLKPNEQLVDSGKALPPEAVLAQNVAQHEKDTPLTPEQQAHQLATQDMKHTAAQASAQTAVSPNADKAALSAMPEALVAANLNPAAQAASSAELSKKVMNAGLAAGVLKGVSSKQDKPEPQRGLAGQIQAAAGQQGVTAQQQVRVDAAQQAQLPLQLTKELVNDQVAEKVQMMMSKNLKNLDIRLDPPELGRMQIRMTMNNDLANVHFTVANPQARDLIEQTLPRLREMLAQQGMQLADSSVQQQSSSQQQSGYANAEQNGQSSQGRGFSGQLDENFDADTNLDLNVVSKRDGISFYA